MPQFDTPINTNDQSLDRVLANPLPVLLVFAPDTPTFSTMKSVLDEVARDYAGKLLVTRIATSENPTSASRFKATSIALVLWKAGAEQLRLEFPTPDQIRQAAKYALGLGPAPQARYEPQAQPAGNGSGSTASADGHPISVSEATFEQQVLRSAEPVLVDFWASWCGPCRMIAPTLDKLAKEYAGQIRIAKLNVDESPHLASRYGAQSIPLLVIFKNGKPVKHIIGAHPEPSIRSFIESVLH